MKTMFKGTVEILCIGLLSVFCFSSISCDKLREVREGREEGKIIFSNCLQDTAWKLVGVFDTETDTLIKELVPKDCEECYTFTFDTNSTFKGRITNNIIDGYYKIECEISNFRFINIGGTEAIDLADGYLYRQILGKIQSFTVKDTYLYLYYDDGKNYLKYKKIGG